MSISNSVMVLFCILGAAVSRFFVAADRDNNGFPKVQDEQIEHMRRVRMRNLMGAEREARRRGGKQRGKMEGSFCLREGGGREGWMDVYLAGDASQDIDKACYNHSQRAVDNNKSACRYPNSLK
jgi:hypothetical protein